MIVLGIDPGLATVGCAAVSEEKGVVSLLHSQAILTPKELSTGKRLQIIYDGLATIIKDVKPQAAAMENLYFNTNITTAFTVGQARGVVQLALAQNNLPIAEYSPVHVKLTLTGYGNASKTQMQKMVSQILKLPGMLKPDDVADAAAIALTYCFSYKLSNLKTQMSNVKSTS